jgi:ribosomal-protein-alanine N-acetyltransferase
MNQQPTLKTERLILRPYTLQDAPDLQKLIGEREIAATTMRIPHPYEDGMAEKYIGSRQESFDKGEIVSFAIIQRQSGFFTGGIALTLDNESNQAEMGYWIGNPYWNKGYGTEAARAVLKYGFEVLGLNRIHAKHFKNNPASGYIMQKIGMKHEGCLRQHFKKWGNFVDLELYGILKSEYIEHK